jgi:hypothetical protein
LWKNTKPDTGLINRYASGKPWDNYHVPKAMRKGKRPEDIDVLRKELWKQNKMEEK